MRYTDILIVNGSESFVERVMNENLWSKTYTLRVIEEYKKFIYLARIQSVAPSYEIDQVWHTHLLYTKDYKMMCDSILGSFLHHNPTDKDSVKTEGKNKYITTKWLYFNIFGYNPPLDIWTNWRERNNVTIDLNKHWVIPVGDWKALFTLLIKQIKF